MWLVRVLKEHKFQTHWSTLGSRSTNLKYDTGHTGGPVVRIIFTNSAAQTSASGFENGGHTHTHMHTHTPMRAHLLTCADSPTQTCLHKRSEGSAYISTRKLTRVCMLTRPSAHTGRHVHTYTCAHIHTEQRHTHQQRNKHTNKGTRTPHRRHGTCT